MFPNDENCDESLRSICVSPPKFSSPVFTWNELGTEDICYQFIEHFLYVSAVLIIGSLYFIHISFPMFHSFIQLVTGRPVILLARHAEGIKTLCIP